ncbi:ribonuclease VapC [Steroidobacter agaridevorans]|uniref:Ribonuclease VapC n=1 Tax=Steroidobacter agaridevorans TaxID=2695856 RepID=A0A829YN19_9GAMM|nr:PIN domain-containing protein [Steroidobacter agaridevorans]GFE84737.1 ribonuclease VapC [Steroidobacter agaridevorans]
MSLFVDTSVWSLFLRRDQPADLPEIVALRRALESGERIVMTGLVLQELLQGFSGPKAREQIIDRFAAFPLLAANREDYIAAAALRNDCRKHGVQSGTIDALIAQLCVHHDLTLLTTDGDFSHIAKWCALRLWRQ